MAEDFDADKKPSFSEKLGFYYPQIRRLDVFGAATTSDFRSDSDVDVLVQFERDGTGLFDCYFELTEIFGRPVDVVVEDTIKNLYFKQGVERNRRNVYAA